MLLIPEQGKKSITILMTRRLSRTKMSSARRPRTGSRRLDKNIEGKADRDEDEEERSKQKKRKLSDMLGPQWTANDLKIFYRAFRKHGKDWRKVAVMLRNRTSEMVEVLYNMNKAYLSLPEGVASVAGLIAMMTDHYNILEESRTDEDESSEDFAGLDPSQKIPTLLHNRLGSTVSGGVPRSGVPQVGSAPSSYGGPSPAKKPRTAAVNRPRFMGKRTPHIPIMHLVENKSTAKPALHKEWDGLEQDSFGDCDEVQVALVLAAASQRAASPQVSCTPACKTGHMKSSPVNSENAKEIGLGAESGGSGPKHTGSNMRDGGVEGSQESKDIENGAVTKASPSVATDGTRAMGRCGFPLPEVKSRSRRGQKPSTKKVKVQDMDSARLVDDSKEECSCTEEGTGRQEGQSRDADMAVTNGLKHAQAQKKKRPTPQRFKKRSRQLFSGDESSGLDALATLADLSLSGLLPSPSLGSDPAKVKEVIKGNTPPTAGAREAVKEVGDTMEGQKQFQSGAVQGAVSCTKFDSGSAFEADVQRAASLAELKKRKRKAVMGKIGARAGSGSVESEQKLETSSHVEDVKFCSKLKRSIPGHPTRQAIKSVKQLDVPFSSEQETQRVVVGESEVEHASAANLSMVPVRQIGRRKVLSAKAFGSLASGASVDGEGATAGEDMFSGLKLPKGEMALCLHSTAELGRSSNKARLMHCLSSSKVRRWCTYEWFYSAIDLPWFAKNEFVEYLNHAGLGHVPRLTRIEWGVIRSSLGKPRRLSKRFLQEERDKLEIYRDSVRKHYHEIRSGHRDGLPTDLPRPLTVGQRVIAHHPKTGELHDGSILTVDHNKCRVQFDRPELGVEFVLDIDTMPSNALENFSEVLVHKSDHVDVLDGVVEDDLKSRIAADAGAARSALNEGLQRPGTLPVLATPSSYFLNALCKQAQAADTVDTVIQAKAAANEAVAVAQHAMYYQPCTLAQVQAREADIKALADLTRALDKKEALLVELRNMNDDADVSHKDGESVCNSEPFQKQYATVLLQLKEVNKQVCMALMQLRQRNRYQENIVPPWHRSLEQASGFTNSSSLDWSTSSLDHRPTAGDLSANAKQHARLMVTTAVCAMTSVKEGEDALSKIGAALKSLSKVSLSVPTVEAGDSIKIGDSATCQVGSSVSLVPEPSRSVEVAAAEIFKHSGSGNGSESSYLAELMASCVATLLMVQAFTEKQFPPAEVAVAIDSVLASLQPHSPQNLTIYKEIKHYTGLLKNQIVALVPTQPNSTFSYDLPPKFE